MWFTWSITLSQKMWKTEQNMFMLAETASLRLDDFLQNSNEKIQQHWSAGYSVLKWWQEEETVCLRENSLFISEGGKECSPESGVVDSQCCSKGEDNPRSLSGRPEEGDRGTASMTPYPKITHNHCILLSKFVFLNNELKKISTHGRACLLWLSWERVKIMKLVILFTFIPRVNAVSSITVNIQCLGRISSNITEG